MSVAIAMRETRAKADRCEKLEKDLDERLTILKAKVMILGMHYEEEILINISNVLESIEGSEPGAPSEPKAKT